MESQTVEISDTQHPTISRDGFVYANRGDYMKYLMRRRRGSDLPHYPKHEHQQNRSSLG